MIIATNSHSRFLDQLNNNKIHLFRNPISTLQVNIGKRCNQACHHCHVESGPDRIENMTIDTINQLLALIANSVTIKTIDITGGAPELNPHFRYFVTRLREMNKMIIDRCNLTILFENGQEDTAEFLADNQVQIVASLPCYLEQNVDKQRGKGVFDKSIKALQKLNSLGYGKEGCGEDGDEKGNSQLQLNLVYNPVGIHLPPEQKKLQRDYQQHLQKEFGITFNQLFTITNMPIKRFAHQLEREGKIEQYMQLLIDNFNPHAANNVMCKDLISIGWDGAIYDCDFNQMLDIPVADPKKNIFSISSFNEITNNIVVDDHCFGCTAGSGSSCGGTLV